MKVSCQNRTNKAGSGRESHQSTKSLWLDPCSHPSGDSASFPINLCLVFNFLLFNFFQLSLLCLFDPQMPSYFFSKARPLSLLSLFNANLTSRFPSWHFPPPTPLISCSLSWYYLFIYNRALIEGYFYHAHIQLVQNLQLVWAHPPLIYCALSWWLWLEKKKAISSHIVKYMQYIPFSLEEKILSLLMLESFMTAFFFFCPSSTTQDIQLSCVYWIINWSQAPPPFTATTITTVWTTTASFPLSISQGLEGKHPL